VVHKLRFFSPTGMFEKKDSFAVFLNDVEMDARIDPLVRDGYALPSHPLRRHHLQNFKIVAPCLEAKLQNITAVCDFL